MKIITSLCSGGAVSIAIALLTPSISFADTNQTNASSGTSSHSLVHRVSHSLADSESYTTSGQSGYKWGHKAERTDSRASWAESTPTRTGYKWRDTTATGHESQAFAGTASYDWGVRSYAEQAGYRWGVRNFANQAGYQAIK